jgi:hypothetical protein
MTGRSKTGGFSEDLAKTPGPGHYKVTPPDYVKQNAPKYSMLSRNHMPGGKVSTLHTSLSLVKAPLLFETRNSITPITSLLVCSQIQH